MTQTDQPYYHPPGGEMGTPSDLLVMLAGDDVDRVIRGVIRRVLRSAGRSDSGAEDEEDVRGEVLLLLIRKLRQLGTSASPIPIADFPAYVATVAHHACYAHLRRRRPQWTRLRNQVRYVVSHDPELSLQRDGDEWTCAARVAGRPLDESADLGRLPLRELARALVRRAAGPLRLDDLVAAIAQLRGVHEAAATTPGALDRLADPRPAVTVTFDNVECLRRVWGEVRQLPLRQRWALLLNLRTPDGRGVLPLLPLTGIATLREIATVLELPAAEFARLWKELPFDDLTIAARLGITRQQVINLRKSARDRLNRRLASTGVTERGGNTPGASRLFMVRQDRPVNGAS